MKSLRRIQLPHSLYFITLVTHERQHTLLHNIQPFWESWEGRPLTAWVILPDHFHAILKIDCESISDVIHRFKILYYHRTKTGSKLPVWQKRFWEHIIRNQTDFHRHLDYTHFNPVKHGLAKNPESYRHSSFHEYAAQGFYDSSWRSEFHTRSLLANKRELSGFSKTRNTDLQHRLILRFSEHQITGRFKSL